METAAQKKSAFIFKILLLAALAFFPFFFDLDKAPIRVFDEARPALNAYEMHRYGNYLVPQFGNKPPLLIWMQVFLMKLIGVHELAVRLPSAIAAFLTVFSLVFFTVKYLENFWLGFIAGVILMTTQGFVAVHASRTGDYDALLTFFTTGYLLAFFLYIEKDETRYLPLFFMALTLAVLTKSAQALIFIPGILFYSFMRKKTRRLIQVKWIYIYLLLFIAVIAGYYLLRKHYTPGYLKAVANTDLTGRYFKTLDNHHHGLLFYFKLLVNDHFTTWYWLVPCGIAIGFFINNPMIRQITIFSLIGIVTYLLIISFSRTQLAWYDVPLFPLLALISATPVLWLFDYLKKSPAITAQFKFNVIPFVFLFAVFINPYEKIMGKVLKEFEYEEEFYNLGYFLKWAAGGELSLQNHYLCYDGYSAHLMFYVNILNEQKQNVSFKDRQQLSPGDLVIASQQPVQEYIEKNYACEVIRYYLNIKVYRIEQMKLSHVE